MTRATEAYTIGAILLTTYFILYLGFVPLPETVQEKIIPVVNYSIERAIFSFHANNKFY